MPEALARVRKVQERTLQTRRRLLDAALASLVESGYAGTSTTRIAALTGLSQGALFRHFPTKRDLLVAALEDFYRRLIEEFREGAVRRPRGRAGARASLEALWTMFQRPDLRASFELHMAARTDAGLREALAPIARRHGDDIFALASELFPVEAARGPRFRAFIDTVLSTMNGAAIGAILNPDAAAARRRIDYLRELADELLTPANSAED